MSTPTAAHDGGGRPRSVEPAHRLRHGRPDSHCAVQYRRAADGLARKYLARAERVLAGDDHDRPPAVGRHSPIRSSGIFPTTRGPLGAAAAVHSPRRHGGGAELCRHVVGAPRRMDPRNLSRAKPPTTGSSSRTSWAGCSSSSPPATSSRFRTVRLGWKCPAIHHERTRLFSAKSFLGNLFAMGTPWLIFLAKLEVLPRHRRRPDRRHALCLDVHRGRAHADDVLVVPVASRAGIRRRQRAEEVRVSGTTCGPPSAIERFSFWWRSFLRWRWASISSAIFTYYITIFYLYGGDVTTAGDRCWASTELSGP